MDSSANPLFDRQVVGVVFFGLEWLQWVQWSPQSQHLDVVWCSAVVVVIAVVVVAVSGVVVIVVVVI